MRCKLVVCHRTTVVSEKRLHNRGTIELVPLSSSFGMLYMRPMYDSRLLLLASFDLLGKDSPHFQILLEARSVLVFVVSLVVVVQSVCFLAEDAGLQMVLVVVVASERCF